MNSTETRASERLATELFDQVLVPLAAARRARGAQICFPLGRDGATSYFSRPAVAVMQAADFEFPGGGVAGGLIDALATYWEGSGERDLRTLTPLMHEMASALQDEAVESDGNVNVFCYAMF